MSRFVFAVLTTGLCACCFAQQREEIVVWGAAPNADDKGTDAVVRVFEEEHPQFKVTRSGMGAGQMDPQKLMTAIVGNVAPDVVRQDRFTISDWASRGAFLSLNNYIERDKAQPDSPREADYYKAPWQEATYDGQVYGIPIGSDVRVLYWNKKVFREGADRLKAAGLDPTRPPRTWTEYDRYAVALTKKDKDGNIEVAGGLANSGNTWFYMYSIQNLGAFISKDGKKSTFDTPENLEALTFMVDAYNHIGNRQATRAFEQGFNDDSNDPFIKDKLGMVVTGEWSLAGYDRYKPDLDFGAALPPVPDDRYNRVGRFKDSPQFATWSGGFAWAIPRGSKHADAAWEFIKFASSLRGKIIEMAANSDLAKSKGHRYTPRIWAMKAASQKAAELYASGNSAFDKAFRVHVAAMEYSQCRGQTFAAQAVWDAHAKAFQNAVDGVATPREALKQADVDVQKVLDEFYIGQQKPLADVKTPLTVASILAVVALFGFAIRVRSKVKSKVQAQEALAGYAFISPWIFGFLILTAGPMLTSLYLSFTIYNVLSPPRWVGFDNYSRLFTEDLPMITRDFSNVGYLCAIQIPLSMTLGLLVAMLLNTGIKGMRFFRTAFYLPAIVPAIASVILWITLLNPSPASGLINSIWHVSIEPWFGVKPPGWLGAPEWAKSGVMLKGLWGVGSGMILWLAGLKAVPTTLYEASGIDGASPWQQFWKVTIPQLTPLIFFNLIMSIISVIQTFDDIYVIMKVPNLSSGDALEVPVVRLFMEGFTYFRMGYASAIAWVLFSVVLAATMINLALRRKWVYQEVDS